MLFSVEDLKPVTIRTHLISDKDEYKSVVDGYIYGNNECFFPKNAMALCDWVIDDYKKWGMSHLGQPIVAILPRNTDNLRIEEKDGFFNIKEDFNPANTAIPLQKYRITISITDENDFGCVVFKNQCRMFENDDVAIEWAEKWTKTRLCESSPKAQIFIRGPKLIYNRELSIAA